MEAESAPWDSTWSRVHEAPWGEGRFWEAIWGCGGSEKGREAVWKRKTSASISSSRAGAALAAGPSSLTGVGGERNR